MQTKQPRIVMSSGDHVRLSALVSARYSSSPAVCAYLVRELDRARVVKPEKVNSTTVTMGSRVEFTYGPTGARKIVTLVFPDEEDISTGRISVLTPIGAALIGLSEGQSILFQTPSGEERGLSVVKVSR